MAIPWLIGGLIVGGAALAAKALSSDDDGDDGKEERRRRREAERKRKEREQAEKKQAIEDNIQDEGDRKSTEFKQILNGVVDVSYDSKKPFKYEITEDNSSDDSELGDLMRSLNDSVREMDESMKRFAVSSLSNLEILDSKTIANLGVFTQLYHVELSPSQYLMKQAYDLSLKKQQLSEIEILQKKLSQYKNKMKR